MSSIGTITTVFVVESQLQTVYIPPQWHGATTIATVHSAFANDFQRAALNEVKKIIE